MFIALEAEGEQRRAQDLAALNDVRRVTGFSGRRITVQGIEGGPEASLPALAHVVASVGDEVMVTRLATGWIVTGNLSAREPVE
jgi:hypothetical protein